MVRIEVRVSALFLDHFLLGVVLADGRRVRLAREDLVAAITGVRLEVTSEEALFLFKESHFNVLLSYLTIPHRLLNLLVVRQAVQLDRLIYLLHLTRQHILHLHLLHRLHVLLLLLGSYRAATFRTADVAGALAVTARLACFGGWCAGVFMLRRRSSTP